MPFAALGDGSEQVYSKCHPNDGDCQIDRPLQFRILFGLADAERQRDGRCDDDGLPTPKVEGAQGVVPHPGLEQPLERVVDGGEADVAYDEIFNKRT